MVKLALVSSLSERASILGIHGEIIVKFGIQVKLHRKLKVTYK